MNRFFNVLVALVMLLMTSCSSFPEQQTSKAITDVMDEFQAVGISAAVVKDGKIVYNKSFGYKDLATKTPLGNDWNTKKYFRLCGKKRHDRKEPHEPCGGSENGQKTC